MFNGSTVTGGDVPGHLYLIASLQEALLGDISIRHYAFGFWCGFPLFLFYFPFPYLVGALLALVFDLSTSFKILTVVPYFIVPLSFAFFARSLSASRLLQAAASLLGVSWFFTDAHVMWGGNALSTLSGMIAQGWAMPLVVFAIAALLQVQKSRNATVAAVVFGCAAVLSHFYAMLLLATFIAIIIAQDIYCAVKKTPTIGRNFYIAISMIFLVTLWWYLPLSLNIAQSSEFGGHWNIQLLDTFGLRQKLTFVLILAVSAAGLFLRPSLYRPVAPFLLLVIFCILIFASSYFSSSTAFNNIRFWPILFLSLYLLTIACFVVVFSSSRRAAVFLLLLFVFFGYWPSGASFESSRSWLEWNFSGVEAKAGASDFRQIVSLLQQLPAGRVSAESNDEHNTVFGSVRVFELLPALTQHEFVEGAIVNSARLPGIPYFLQCLVSRSCAGWPPGSLMPEFDVQRGLSMMRSLGVSYHIGNNQTFDWGSLSSQGVETLFKGEFVSLYKIASSNSLVEVFEQSLPTVNPQDARAVLLQLPRWDFFRSNPVVFSTESTVKSESFLMFLVSEWIAGRRVADRGYQQRFAQREKFRNIFVMDRGSMDGGSAAALPTFFIADRPFEPNLFLPSAFEADLSLRYEQGLAGNRLDVKQIRRRGITMTQVQSDSQSLIFGVDWKEPFPELDIELEHPTEVLPRSSQELASKRITDSCKVGLEKRSNELRLSTSCVDKPHLIKYSFSEHWHYDGPIYIASNGFIVVTPKAGESTLTWQQ